MIAPINKSMQIINNIYENKEAFRKKLEIYNLNIEDIGIVYFRFNPFNSLAGDKTIVFNSKAPMFLWFSIEDNRVVSCFVDFTHDLIKGEL
jgi:hypothetical protein